MRPPIHLITAAALLLAGGASEAHAQLGIVTCVATAVPPIIRAEGIAELTGDIVLACTNPGFPGGLGTSIQTNLSVSLNVNITNNIDFGGSDITDAVLVVNENNCSSPASAGATFGGCSTPDPRFQDPQLGKLAATNRIEWEGFVLPIPGANDGEGDVNPTVTTLRITGIRANASQLGVPDAPTFPSTQVTAFVSITGPATIPITNNVLNVAVPIIGLIVDPDSAAIGLQCDHEEITSSVTLEEGFATSFKTTGRATFTTGQTQWESGYYTPGSNNGGGASSGTRFLLRFFNIPDGVSVSVPRQIETGSAAVASDAIQLGLVTGADPNGAGGTVTTEVGDHDVSLSGGFGSAVYEVLDSDPFRIEEVAIPIKASWTPDTANDLPAVGAGQISASFAPLSTVVVASSSAPEPRFLDNSGDPSPLLSITRCTTTLLFPFINGNTIDSRVTIANPTGLVPGIPPAAGACRLTYRQAGPFPPSPEPQTSAVIQPGDTLEFSIRDGNAAMEIEPRGGFEGHLFVECDFREAVGRAESDFFTFSDLGDRHDAQPAPVIPDNPTLEDRTRMLFPYASSLEGGENSVLRLANTNNDEPSANASGRCMVEAFGPNAPAPFESEVISPGRTERIWLNTLSTDFEGFVIVDCPFPGAVGYSRVGPYESTGLPPYAYSVPPEPIEPIEQAVSSAALSEESAAASPGSVFLLHGIEDKNTLATKLEFANYGPAPATCSVQPTTSQGIALAPVPVAVPAMSPATLDFDVPGTFKGWMLITCDQSTVQVLARSLATDNGTITAAFAQSAERLEAPRADNKNFVVYPFVQSVDGVDARISLTNTSLDSLESVPVSNACTLSFHGEVEGGSTPSDAEFILAAGEQIEFNLFQGLLQRGIPGALGFRGFLVAACEGPLARGFDYRFTTPEAATPAVCEVDEFEGIDSRDIRIIRQARGQRVEEGDPRDFDGDGRITLNDRNQCRARCTLPRCAPVQP